MHVHKMANIKIDKIATGAIIKFAYNLKFEKIGGVTFSGVHLSIRMSRAH